MEKYKVEIKKSAVKEIENLPKRDIHAVLKKIESLAQNPRQAGTQKLSGQERYRIRSGDYRIVYSIEDLVLIVLVVKVGHRKNVYQ